MDSVLEAVRGNQQLGIAADALVALVATAGLIRAKQPLRSLLAARGVFILCLLDLIACFPVRAAQTAKHTAFLSAALALAVYSLDRHAGSRVGACLHAARALRLIIGSTPLTPAATLLSLAVHVVLAWHLLDGGTKQHVRFHLDGIFAVKGFAVLRLYHSKQQKLDLDDLRDPASENAHAEDVRNTEFDPTKRVGLLSDAVGATLAEILNIWIVASRIGWQCLIPIVLVFGRELAAYAVKAKVEQLRKQSKKRVKPRICNNFHNMARDIGSIKFYAWENAFRDVRTSMDKNNFVPPPVWRIAQLLIDIVGCATSQVASAIAIMSSIQAAGVATYSEVALLMESIDSLVTFSTMATAVGTTYASVKKSAAFLRRITARSNDRYIPLERTPSARPVELENCTFSWGPGAFSVQCPLLRIDAGELVTIVGRIGSGKSSLVSALCGEMPMLGGQGRMCGKIGYVDQKPWIYNTTFRKNVLMGEEYDEEWFSTVIRACALSRDLEQLENGDQTLIGFGGVNLSGGQKARLALARALYRKADVYVFDDLLSAVDAHVERHIIENVLVAGGIISTKTRILVTHAEHVVPLSDKVVTLSDGRVEVTEQEPTPLAKCSADADAAEVCGVDSGQQAGTPVEKPVPFVVHPEYENPPFRWTHFKKYLALSGYWTVAFVVAIQVVSAYAVFYIDGLRISLMTDSNADTMAQSLKHYLLVNALVEILRRQLSIFGKWIQAKLWSEVLMERMRSGVLDVILTLPLATIENLSSSSAVLDSVQEIHLRKVEYHIEKTAEMLFFGTKLIRIHGTAEQLLGCLNWWKAVDIGVGLVRGVLASAHSLVTTVFTELIQTSVLLLKLWQRYYLHMPVSAGEIDVAITASVNMFKRLSDLATIDRSIASPFKSAAKYFIMSEQVAREPPAIIEACRPPTAWPSDGRIEFQNYSMRYRSGLDLVLKDLSFTIGRREKVGIVGRTGAGKSSLTHAIMRMVEPAAGRLVIDGVDITTIGVHDLRSRISIIPQDPALFWGSIRDNLDPVNEYTDDEVWAAIRAARMAHLLEKPTDKYVEDPNDDDDDDGVWVEGVGLDKWVKYGGANFSVGERQLISLCRALLWRRKILILDEATANIDSQTDQIIQAVLRQEFTDCTILTIAHRLNTVMDCDRILVMDRGSVAEFDTPANLLARNGHFSQLVKSMELNQGH
ncbi:hypothetical protein H4S01_002116 [Coemansia sp. RSA 2610]|nr:hypothetical protein H4S01_002116 [Coemansia sp. RSA 2610]